MRSLALALALVAGCAESHGRAPDAGGEPCGPVTCGEGTYCCNASCGVCVPPGTGCYDVACVDGGGACAAQDAVAEGPCEAELGVVWTGYGCRTISGCTCAGADCGALFGSAEACVAAHPGCARLCGTRGGLDCLPSELCDYTDGAFCGGDDSGGTCVARPTECAEPGGVPVCGCDRRDYFDACSAQVAGVDVMHLGPCDGSAPIALRSARMFGECGIAGGVLTHIELADDVRSCSGELGRSVRVTLFENLDLSRAPRTFSLGGTSVEGRADACTDGAAGTSCVTASGTITVHAYASGEIARLEYDVRAADGARYAASDLALTGLFCPFVHPGCR